MYECMPVRMYVCMYSCMYSRVCVYNLWFLTAIVTMIKSNRIKWNILHA
jgi:hypothetical protein